MSSGSARAVLDLTRRVQHPPPNSPIRHCVRRVAHTMALPRCYTLLLSLLFSLLLSVYADNTFENSAVVRTVELAGSLVHVRTTFAAKALDTGAKIYAFALGREDGEKTSYLQAKIKGQQEPLELQHLGLSPQT